MINVFSYLDYKTFLKAAGESRLSGHRGFRSRLAETLDCQNAYISQVLNTDANFSLEQALKISAFLRLKENETDYFILLVQYARAGTKELSIYFKRDIEKAREQYLNIKNRVPEARTLAPEDQNIYYSSWIYSSIHILVTIPNFNTVKKIATSLSLDENTVGSAVMFLLSTGLLVEKKEILAPGPTQIHLEKHSPHINKHHSNWRISAIHSLSSKNSKSSDIHYSTVSSLSRSDVEVLKNQFIAMIQTYVETVRPSKEEALYNFNLDFYSLMKP